MWKDIHTALIRPALAKLLPGVQGKVQIDGNGNENVQLFSTGRVIAGSVRRIEKEHPADKNYSEMLTLVRIYQAALTIPKY